MALTFGYVLPTSEGASVASPGKMFAIAEACEAAGLEHLWVSDHILWWLPMHDSVSLLASLAVKTSRIRIGPAVLLLAMRNPVLIAKSLATVNELSEGRLTVGVGVGGEFPPEWDAVGVSRRTRGRRTDEMIDALRGLWNGPFTASGRHVQLNAVDLHPKPAAMPPIWIGGRRDASIARAAARGDGWMGIFLTPEQCSSAVSNLDSQAADLGRDPSMIAKSLYVWTSIGETDKEGRRNAELLSAFYNLPFEKFEKFAVFGSPETCAARLHEFAQSGIENFAVAPIFPEVSTEPVSRLDEVKRLLEGQS